MSELLYVEDTASGEMHASRTAEVGGPRGDALVFEDARYCQTVCGDEIAADDVGTWSQEEPHGKTAQTCPECDGVNQA